MLKTIDVQNILARITYKPTTEFIYSTSPRKRLDLHMTVPNSGGDNTITLDSFITIHFRDLRSESTFLRAVKKLVSLHEEHESREWLRIDRLPLSQPHPNDKVYEGRSSWIG